MLILQILGAIAVLLLLGVYLNVRDIQYRVERWTQSQFDKEEEETEPSAESGSYSRMYADAYDRDKQSKGQSEK